jgi:hypothetical protein
MPEKSNQMKTHGIISESGDNMRGDYSREKIIREEKYTI